MKRERNMHGITLSLLMVHVHQATILSLIDCFNMNAKKIKSVIEMVIIKNNYYIVFYYK